jgi:PAS domain S-box-containing protein
LVRSRCAGLAHTPKAQGRATSNNSSKDANMRATPTFHDEVAERLGVLPNFFCSAQAAPGVIERLWDFAKSAYLDNPLPSLFKERLFVHLSRFCVVRYCIVRHVGFLVGHGRPAGDGSVEPETVDKVIALLRRPVPASEALEAALGRLSARTVMEPIPDPGTEFEHDLFDALTVLFLAPLAPGLVREAVRTAVGEVNLEFLLAFMAFIRAAHYWTETHSDLTYEAELLGLMERHPELRELLLDPAEAEQTRGAIERMRALATLREREEQFQAVVGALEHNLQAQEAEAAELGRYRLLVNAVTDYAIYMLDPNGRIASWNPGVRRLKGYEEAEILGQHFSRFYVDEDRAAGLPTLALAAAAKEGRFEGEGWRVRKDGSRFWANVIIDPIRNPAGELVGYAKITRDLTERREAQLSLERTREALFQAQKMEAIGQLTGGIAHDFNNLLTAIIGSLEIVRRRATDASVIRLIDNALRGAERGSSLTHRMLIFARRQELDFQSVDIVALVHGMAELLERSLGPSVRIETRFPLRIPLVNTDANQLEMALLNLAVNARDAMPRGGSIVIAARPETVALAHGRLQPGEYVCLSLTDAGEGMDEDTLARAIDPFFTTKEVGKGTGLGLPMVHGLAEHSGGQLILRSQKGRGTTAELWLLVAKKTAKAAEAKAPAQVPAKEHRRLIVLAVDDDPLVLTNMAAMLDDVGHTVFEASSAREALAILRREGGIQLVITDQGMPHMTGLQLIEEIKDNWPDLPVILATGFAELPPGTDRRQITLAKPFHQDDLAYAVETAMTTPDERRVLSFRVPAR